MKKFHRTNSTIDNTDWLKTAAIILVMVDHIGYFFIENADWWSVFGRMAAPMFFFLIGYARTKTVPFNWIWLGVLLTLLDSWNSGWAWVTPNILISFALVRAIRPYVELQLQRHGWVTFALIVIALLAVLPIAAEFVDYGAEGWLWALVGLCQRMYVDDKQASGMDSAVLRPTPLVHAMIGNMGLMRLLACFIAAVVYVWQEQMEFSFSKIHLVVFILSLGVLSLSLCQFLRGPSRVKPPESIAIALRFIGRHTMEIYAIQLAGSELIKVLLPDLTV